MTVTVAVLAAALAVLVAAAAAVVVRRRRHDPVPVPEPVDAAATFAELRLRGPARARLLTVLTDSLDAAVLARVDATAGDGTPPPLPRALVRDLQHRVAAAPAGPGTLTVPTVDDPDVWEQYLHDQMTVHEQTVLAARPAPADLDPDPGPDRDRDGAGALLQVPGALDADIAAAAALARTSSRLPGRRRARPVPQPKTLTVAAGDSDGPTWQDLGLPEDVPRAFLS